MNGNGTKKGKLDARYVIYSSFDIDPANLDPDFIRERYPDMYPTEDELWELAYKENSFWRECVQDDLRIPVYEVIAIADLGLWNGKHRTYYEFDEPTIGDLMTRLVSDKEEWWVDYNGDLHCETAHHDGYNHYLLREWKPEITDKQKDNFYGKILEGTVTRADLRRYTNSIGDSIANVYGLETRNVNQKAKAR